MHWLVRLAEMDAIAPGVARLFGGSAVWEGGAVEDRAPVVRRNPVS